MTYAATVVPTPTTTSSSTSITLQSGIVDRDIIFILAAGDSGAITIGASGYTVAQNGVGDGGVIWKYATGTEGGTSVTLTGTGGNDAMASLVVRGASGNPVVVSTGSGGTNSIVVPAVHVTGPALQALAVFGQENGTSTTTFTNGWTSQCFISRWFPAVGWAIKGYEGTSPGVATTATFPDTGVINYVLINVPGPAVAVGLGCFGS